MKLIEQVFETNEIHQLAEQLSHIFNKAIIIENKNFELIAYSSPNEFSFDPIQQKTILTKRCPLFIIERLKKEGYIAQLNRKSEPIRIEAMEDISFYQRVVISLTHENKVYGYLWIYEADELLEDNDLSLLTKTSSHLGKVLHELQSDAVHDEQSVIWKLLNNEYLNQAEIYREANIASYTLPENFIVVVASIKDSNYLYVLDKVKELFIHKGISFYLGKGTDIVGVVSGDDMKLVIRKSNKFISDLQKTLSQKEQAAIFIGLGNAYQQIQQVRKSYLEALEVIETMVFLHMEEQVIYHYNALGMYRYIKLMYKKNVGEQYRNKSIDLLMQQDTKNNSELLKTLWYFLKNDCKVGQTADKLFIHPNTLNYRVKQIVSTTGIDFSNVDEKMELYSQLLILHYVPDFQNVYKK